VHRDAHDRPRHDDRERGPAVDPGRPRVLPGQPGLGGERLSDRVRRAAPAGRAAGRPGRAATGVPGRPGPVLGRLAAVRARGQPGHAHRGAVPAGHRRRADLGRHPRHDRDDVPRPARAGPRDRRVRLRRVGRRRRRPARGRRPHPAPELALDLLREPADRRSHRARRPPPDPARARLGPARRGRRARRGADHRRDDARGVHDRRRGRSRSAGARWRCWPASSSGSARPAPR